VVITQRTPAMEHFSIPSASDGKLFLATGQTVQAYTIANPAPAAPTPATPVPAPSPPAPAPTSAAAAPTTPPPGISGIGCELKLRSARVVVDDRRRGTRRQSGQRNRMPFGTLALRATCHRVARVTLSGQITSRLGNRRKRTSKLEPKHATLRANHARTLRLRVPAPLVRALREHRRETGTFTLATRAASAMAAGGATTARATVHARLRI
jgi:hypothetical protein